MLAHFQELKAQMNKVRDVEREKLTKVTLESNAAMKEIKRQKDKVTYSQGPEVIPQSQKFHRCQCIFIFTGKLILIILSDRLL